MEMHETRVEAEPFTDTARRNVTSAAKGYVTTEGALKLYSLFLAMHTMFTGHRFLLRINFTVQMTR